MAQGIADDLVSLRAPPGLAEDRSVEYENHIRHVIKILRGYRDDEYVTGKGSRKLLDDLDPILDTLPYLFVLCAKARFASTSCQSRDELRAGAPLWSTIVTFLEHCDPVEIRYAGAHWLYLYETIEASSQHPSATGQKIPVLSHLVTALLHLDPSCSVFTPKHLDLVRLGLLNAASSQILLILERSFSHIPRKSVPNPEGYIPCYPHCPSRIYLTQSSGFIAHAITLPDVQEYFITGALNLIALQKWQRAKYFLEHVLVTPCNKGANGYMVEAYKKWVLISLLVHGHAWKLSLSISSATRRTIEAMAKPYESVAEAFARSDHKKVVAEVQEADAVWHEDGNVGLVQQVLCDHQRRAVTKLSTVYAALPLAAVADRIAMPEEATTQYLRSLIREQKVAAQLDQRHDGLLVLRFLQGPNGREDPKPESQMRDELVQQTQRIQMLAVDLQTTEHLLSMKKPWLDHHRRKNKLKPDDADPEPMDLTFSQPNVESEEDDEELMSR